ncbi:hypothetical protein THAOC_33777, partial [Thalassiosira oceanica]
MDQAVVLADDAAPPHEDAEAEADPAPESAVRLWADVSETLASKSTDGRRDPRHGPCAPPPRSPQPGGPAVPRREHDADREHPARPAAVPDRPGREGLRREEPLRGPAGDPG